MLAVPFPGLGGKGDCLHFGLHRPVLCHRRARADMLAVPFPGLTDLEVSARNLLE
jgi:hypothetical protein